MSFVFMPALFAAIFCELLRSTALLFERTDTFLLRCLSKNSGVPEIVS